MEEDNDWYIYEPDDILSLSTPCYIAPRPEFDEKEEEIFPEYMNRAKNIVVCRILRSRQRTG